MRFAFLTAFPDIDLRLSVSVPYIGVQPGCLLGGTVEQGLAVELAARKYSQPARRAGAYAGVLFAVGRARGRVENRSRANLEGGLLVDLDEQDSVEQQVDLGVGDRSLA
jgi:hypothetical protein